MSGPTWLPPKQPEPARTPQGRAIPRGTPGPPPAQGAVLPGPRGTGGSGAGLGGVPWSTPAHADRGGLRPGSLDAEIDLLSSTLAELNGGRGHAPQRPDRQAYEPLPPPAYRTGSLKPNPASPLPASSYGGPTPASYATASTPAGPAFPVQVKVAQPVRGCGPPRRGASQASGPLPGPHFPLPGRGEVWGPGYRSQREPGPGAKEEAAGVSGPAGRGRGGEHGPQSASQSAGITGMSHGARPIVASFQQECGLLLSSEGECQGCYPLDGHILCKACSAWRIQELSATVTTDC
ncbi:thyroid receptor-interacting protein 6-like [Hylobates moloch]|uniref:thyroid receptor-interacting protein 6-like n=1 Tax=Hylobates moloch TaxID=81572 RepID=UPI002674D884|nr:thyroid receptor-interacting protein 6-like [Hylobates moloch]